MLTDTSRWSHARGNEAVPSRWQATASESASAPTRASRSLGRSWLGCSRIAAMYGVTQTR